MRLKNKKVAILVSDGFEQVEMTKPREALNEAGAETVLVSPSGSTVKGWNHDEWGDTFDVDESLKDADPANYDALLLPGGVINPDSMRRNEEAQSFIEHFFNKQKTVAAICHAPWLLVDKGLAKGRRLTSYHTIQADLKNAGADWVDEEVVLDKGLITSRNPDDIPAFNAKLIETLSHN